MVCLGTRQYAEGISESESESNWIDECTPSEGISFQEYTLSFRKIHLFPGRGAKSRSMLSSGIRATQPSDDARPLQDWETRQRMLEEELDHHLRRALLRERIFGRCIKEDLQKPKIIAGIHQGISSKLRQTRSDLKSQTDKSSDEVIDEHRVW